MDGRRVVRNGVLAFRSFVGVGGTGEWASGNGYASADFPLVGFASLGGIANRGSNTS